MLTADYFLPAKGGLSFLFWKQQKFQEGTSLQKTDDIYNTQIFIHRFLTKVQWRQDEDQTGEWVGVYV